MAKYILWIIVALGYVYMYNANKHGEHIDRTGAIIWLLIIGFIAVLELVEKVKK
jgi:hypothetical protein